MILDRLIEFCDKPEHRKAFPVSDVKQFVAYFFTHGLVEIYEENGEIRGVALARLIRAHEKMKFDWFATGLKGNRMVIDSVVALDPKAKRFLIRRFHEIRVEKYVRSAWVMRRGKFKKLTNKLLERLKWEQE